LQSCSLQLPAPYLTRSFETIHDEFEFVDDNLCGAGLGVEVAVAVDIRVQALARGRDGLVYFRQHVAETDVLPNLANEETVTSSGEGRRHARGLRVSLRHVPG
jgi:hypothetical protein